MTRESTAISVPGWLLAAAVCLPLLGLGAPLIEVDDARYAEVPREMAASGDWTVPTLNGLPYVEKPPLWYWSAASVMSLLGPSEAAARLPMALYAALGVLGTWWLGTWLYGASVARAGALAVATAALWVFLSHNMTLDMPLSVCLLWTTALALRAMERPGERWAAPAAWLAAALAFLAKGLIALLLPAAWVIGLAVLFPRWRRGAAALAFSWGAVLFVAVAAPWYLSVQARRPDFLHTFFVEQHFQRYLTPKYDRGAGWWFFLVVVPAGLLPWTAAFLAGAAGVLRAPLARREDAALAAWIAGVVLFFSLSSSKLATYALPVFPHAALLACAALERGLPGWARTVSRGLGALLLAAAAVLAGAALAPERIPRLPPWLDPEALRAPAALACGVLLSLGGALLRAATSKRAAFVLGAGGALAGALALGALRVSAPWISAKAVAGEIRAGARPGDELWTYGCYLHGLPFYSGLPVETMIYFVGELHYAKREEKYAGRFGDDDALRYRLPRRGGRTWIVLRAFERPHVESVLGGRVAVRWSAHGPWELGLVEAGQENKR